jgi:hypothetical protein
MVSKKGTRKFVYNGKVFYWFVKRNQLDYIKIYILSDDKKIRLECDPIDSEAIIEPNDIRILLDNFFTLRNT